MLEKRKKELLEAHKALALTDQELKTLLNRWDIRVKKLSKMRDEVIEGANSLNN
jgi:flagellar motility protein MotE (MotC chaperone)